MGDQTCLKEHIHFVKCECGEEILLISEVKKMSKAIEEHVTEHMKNESDPIKAEVTGERIRDFLIKQVLDIASGCS